jgi:hypothetical protein
MLREKIKILYPTLTDVEFNKYIKLENKSDGNGPYIAKWDHPGLVKPSQTQLNRISDTEANQARLIKTGEVLVQRYLDKKAQEYGYDNILSAVSYSTSTRVTKYLEEGQQFSDWRAVVWESFYQSIEDGNDNINSIIASLPEFNSLSE